MVKIFLCGPGGSGKSTIAENLRKQNYFGGYQHIEEVARILMKDKGISGEDLKDFNSHQFQVFQKDILLAQCEQEEAYSKKTCFISDRSILDCLAYSIWKCPEKEGNTKSELELICQKFMIKHVIDEAIKRYQTSLFVFVHPWSNQQSSADGTRLSMSAEDSEKFCAILKELLLHFKIGYLDLYESDRRERVETIFAAVKEGKVKRNTYCLQYYKQISDKPKKGKKCEFFFEGDKNRQGNHHETTILSFFLDYNIQKEIRSVQINEDHYLLSTQTLGLKQGRIFKELNIADLVSISFDMKLRSNEVEKILLKDIYIGGELYNFLGCSNGGLKDRKVFLFKGIKETCEKVLYKYGQFENIKSVSKRMARFGLLFSSVLITEVMITDQQILHQRDIERGGYNFTDGCGGVGLELARAIYQSLPEEEKINSPAKYQPSVYQFRLNGLKGVVALDPKIPGGKILVRPSMTKFKSNSFPYFSVCDVSRPYQYGHLNRQLIYLLSALGVPDNTFLDLQEGLFHLISCMFSNKEAALTMLFWYQHVEEANMLSCTSLESWMQMKTIQRKLKKIEQEYLAKDKKIIIIEKSKEKYKEKLRIIVKKSRFLYGVCDQTGSLSYGQCYVRITINGKPKTIEGKIVTGRMPCYLKGDIRILEAVSIPGLQHLVDCIVFPTEGERPHADEQAGGDLDGDKFFVTWDSTLIPRQNVPSNVYPAAANKRLDKVSLHKMIKYFSVQNNTMKMIGLTNNLFEQWANSKGADCNACQWLGQFFGRIIDSGKTGERLTIPEHFRKPPQVDEEGERFVWNKMEEKAKEFKAKKHENVVEKTEVNDEISVEYVEALLEDQYTSLTEYQKFDFLWKFALSLQDSTVEEAVLFIKEKFLHKINFSLFSGLEKREAIDCMGIPPSILFNALRKSKLLSVEDLSHYGVLNVESNWGFVYRSCHSDFIFNDFANSLLNKDNTLIIFKLPDDVCVAIRILTPLQRGEMQCIPSGHFTAIFISKGFSYRKEYKPAEELFYDLRDGRFQIYRKKKTGNSFLSLSSSIKTNELQDVLSVDLPSFGGNIIRATGGNRPHPLVRKTPIAHVEVFASEKNGLPSYPDVLVGNEIEIDLEVIEEEDNIFTDEEGDDRDVGKMLVEFLTKVDERMLSLDDVKRNLKETVAYTAPWNSEISSEAENALKKMVMNIKMDALSWKDGFEIAVYLSRLGSATLADDLLSKIQVGLTTEEFLEILTDWKIVWFLHADLLVNYVVQMKTMLLSSNLSYKEKYIIETAWISFVEFTNDFEVCKENWKSCYVSHLEMAGGEIEDSKDENKNKVENDIVNLYRSKCRKQPHLPNIGDHVLLMRGKDYQRCHNIVQAITSIASVSNIVEFPISMELKLMDEHAPEIVANDKTNKTFWVVVLLEGANITLYTRIIEACLILVKEVSSVLDSVCSILNTESPLLHCEVSDIQIDNEFNTTQRKAISASFVSLVTCIQGPPGCGKTKCACAIIRRAVKMYEGKEILAVAETNTAVDNMTRNLLESKVKVVRIGDLKKISGDLFCTTVEGQLRNLEEQEGKKIEFRGKSGRTVLKKNFSKRIIDDAEVVLTTCAGAGDNSLLGRKFKFVLVDEATQTKQGTLLCALAHKAEQLVLIGDPKQLGPLVKLRNDVKWLPETNVSQKLAQSLFHKLHEVDPAATHLLDTQYRMHPSIAKFPSNTFYEGRIKSGTTPESRSPQWSLGASPVAFVHVDGDEKRRGTSFANHKEERKIEEFIKNILKSPDISKEDVTVLSPYNGQVRALRECLREIHVSSIDGYQGKENEYILVSTVRSNLFLGHADDEHRLNVLLTRAKRGLLIFGHRPTLMTSTIWAKWLETVPQL